MKDRAYKTYVRPLLHHSCYVEDPHCDTTNKQTNKTVKALAGDCTRPLPSDIKCGPDNPVPPLARTQGTKKALKTVKLHHNFFFVSTKFSPSHEEPRQHRRPDFLQFSFLPRTIVDWNNVSMATYSQDSGILPIPAVLKPTSHSFHLFIVSVALLFRQCVSLQRAKTGHCREE